MKYDETFLILWIFRDLFGLLLFFVVVAVVVVAIVVDLAVL